MAKTKNDDEYLNNLRHTGAHLLAKAVKGLWPGTHNAIGPAIENGFYQDFDFGPSTSSGQAIKISESDLPKIEAKMRELLPNWEHFEFKEVTPAEAKKLFKENPYKLELIEEFAQEGKKLLTNDPGNFLDLCKMGHIENPSKELQHFKLLKIAGAYWRGSEKNKMLTRIYGTAFPTKEELDKYLDQLKLAEERDHRKIGKELDLFTFADEVGPGLPLWTPKGTIIKDELEKWAKETEARLGYVRVSTPHIAKHTLFEISGHLPYYRDDMYSPMIIDEEEYFLKGMNCPHHHMIFKSRPKSYRDLPLRYAEYGMVYRYEASGTLFGLMRVRAICQNDAHIYCTMEQAEEEFLNVLKLHEYYYNTLGLKRGDYYIVIGLPDPKKKGKYHGEKALWDKAEQMMRAAIKKSNIDFVDDIGGAAFYGPKIDFNIRSVTGRVFGASTNQLDLYMPTRFNLSYIDSDGSEKLCAVIHRAPLGSHERFIGFLIEHYGGAFPTWLAPVQGIILPIADRHIEYAKSIEASLKSTNIRVEIDSRQETLSSKIRDAQMQKTPYMIVVGDKEIEENIVAVRSRDRGDLGKLDLQKFLAEIKIEIEEKRIVKTT